jgi:hypothetical protein
MITETVHLKAEPSRRIYEPAHTCIAAALV